MIKDNKVIVESEECLKSRGIRNTVRAVIKNDDKVLMLYSEECNDYTFPGGGVLKDESFYNGLKRELKEEIGAISIDVIRVYYDTVEYKYALNGKYIYKQNSRYYLCKVNKFGVKNLTSKEIKNKLMTKWVFPEEALEHNKSVLNDNLHCKRGMKTALVRANHILEKIILEKEEMNMRKFEIIKEYLNKDIKIPTRQTAKSAGYDIETAIDFVINPGEVKLIPTGLKVTMPEDEALFIFPRSSLGFKKHINLANSIGVIDADYYNNADNEGHIQVPLHNFGNEVQEFKKGERIVQGIFIKYEKAIEQKVTSSRKGGFGSSNK